MSGLAFGIGACALWALTFVSPVVLQQFSPLAVALGRYAVFSAVSLAAAPFALRHLRGLNAADWAKAAWLSVVGHLAYYFLLAAAIQLSEVPGPSVVIGLLPLTIPVFANLRQRELPWRPLWAPLAGIAAGLLLVHGHEYRGSGAHGGALRYAAGIGLAFGALACWTWYGIANAAWLRSRPRISTVGWTMAQGIALVPMVLCAALSSAAVSDHTGNASEAEWLRFGVVSVIVGVGSTWLATLCWNEASRRLPTTLAGQLIVFTTIAAVLYGSVYRGTPPSAAVMLGVSVLAAAVALGVRAVRAST